MKVAIVGGGAAGFFCGIHLKEICRDIDVTIFERQGRVLNKVAVSGGGRCNCTNTFEGVSDLSQVYPRGHRLMKRLFNQFGPEDAYRWFEEHGVGLVRQEDHCVFPESQDSGTIVRLFTDSARRLGIKVLLNSRIDNPVALFDEYDDVVVTVGGLPSSSSLSSSSSLIPSVPSLFSLAVDDKSLHNLMGLVVEDAIVSIPSTKFRSSGALLLTHWGMSGPAILKLSSYAARHLAEIGYKSPLLVNWTGISNADEVRDELMSISIHNPNKLLSSFRPFGLQQRLWDYLLMKFGKECRWSELGGKKLNRLVELLCNDRYETSGRAPFKDEFVTCGGVALNAVNPVTMESKEIPHLYFAGEVLDIDGVTGGFNFQACWTTAYAAAEGILKSNACL